MNLLKPCQSKPLPFYLMPNSLAVSTSPPNKQWAGGYDAGPLKYRFQQLLYFILGSDGC
jgi:hypothetical protein